MAFTSTHLYFDDVEVGQEWRSPARTIAEADLVNYSGLSGDFNAIHTDAEFAKSTLYRQRIAHGLLVMAIGSGLALHSPPMRTMAFVGIREWDFKEPVFIGDTVHVTTRILEKEVRSRGRRGQILWQRQIVNQKDAVVQSGVTLTLVEGRAGKSAAKR